MTDAADTIDRPETETLWVTDAEIIRRVGAPRDVARVAIRELDRNPRSGFPRKEKFWGDRRYWPAVRAFFDLHYGPKMDVSQRRSGHGR